MNALQLKPQTKKITIGEILHKASIAYNIKVGRIIGKNYGEAGNARKAAIMAMREYRPDVTFNAIGDLMGRDYSSIIHLNYRAQELFFSDPEFKAKYNHLIQELEALQNNETHAA